MSAVAEVHVKRALPSLIGGIFTAIVAFVLWLLLFGTGSVPNEAAEASTMSVPWPPLRRTGSS